jgi:formylglycine-generating enzyme required for sulfatase activity
MMQLKREARARVIAVASLGLFVSRAHATEIHVATRGVERVAGSDAIQVIAHVTWKNAWRNARNHDAAWLFLKMRVGPNGGWTHARLRAIAADSASPSLTCSISADKVGAFCAPAPTHRGSVSARVKLEVDMTGVPDRVRASPQLEGKVFGIEMVYIPEGPFSIGDKDLKSTEYAAFYRSDASGNHAGPYRLTSEAEIRVAPEAGALYYKTKYAQYEGDRSGPIPAEFPKGTRAFYVMKYELLQGQYAEFLNHLEQHFAYSRAIHGGPGYAEQRGSIRLDHYTYIADKPNRPANWVSWDDGTAFADWAGLRPMTELEFSKAARGPVDPVAGDYPWGTNSKERLLRRMQPDDDLAQTGAADESRLTDSTREALGASYFWVMDLAGSVWEKVVTIGHPTGRAFKGTHGDGTLREYGIATNADWPAGDNETGGYGYRGGGYYERGMPDRDFNPYSPVEWRRFGSWGGAPRSIAYGFRAARTADPGR